MLDLNNPKNVSLSEKEVRILQLICNEYRTKEIADQMNLSPRTVEAIIPKIREKIGARPKQWAGLVIFSLRAYIVFLPDYNH